MLNNILIYTGHKNIDYSKMLKATTTSEKPASGKKHSLQ